MNFHTHAFGSVQPPAPGPGCGSGCGSGCGCGWPSPPPRRQSHPSHPRHPSLGVDGCSGDRDAQFDGSADGISDDASRLVRGSCGVVWVVEELPFSHLGPAYILWSLPRRPNLTYALSDTKSRQTPHRAPAADRESRRRPDRALQPVLRAA